MLIKNTALLLVGSALAVGSSSGFAQTPQFRSSVDLVAVDAVVLDAKGEPATSLAASDFVVTAAGRLRKIVSAQYIRVAASAARVIVTNPVGPTPLPPATSNQTPHTGRSFVIVADLSTITPGNGRLIFDRIGAFVDQLAPEDLVGLAVLPGGSPRVDLTTDHARVREAARTISGVSHQATSEMSPGEAAYIERGDGRAIEDYIDRIGGDPSTPNAACRLGAVGAIVSGGSSKQRSFQINADVRDCIVEAGRMMGRYRQRSRAVLESLAAVATAMAPIAGPKTLVFVSGGLSVDTHNRDDLKTFARAAEAARVSLYALQPPTTLAEASRGGGSVAAGPRLDDEMGLDGLASTAAAARGSALHISGTADAALQQINRETSGYYLLAFERDASDSDNARVPIVVRVNRPGFDVRARSEVTPKPTAASTTPPASGDAKTRLGTLMRWPVPVAELSLEVDVSVTYRDAASSDGQVLLAVDIGAAGATIDALGFEVTDNAGKIVADEFSPQPKTLARPDGGRLYFAVMALPPGSYALKFAAIDGNHRRGSVERRFTVKATPSGALRIGDISFGDESSGVFVPTPKISAAFSARVDVLPTSATELEGAHAFISILGTGTAPLIRSEVALRLTADGTRYQATAALNTATLPAGTYVVTFELRSGERVIATSARQFRQLRPSP